MASSTWLLVQERKHKARGAPEPPTRGTPEQTTPKNQNKCSISEKLASFICVSETIRIMSKTSSDQFEQLVMQCKSSVYSVCYMFADSRDMADDLFQEVLINLWSGFGQVKDKNRIKSWVYRVSLNTCISYKRKKRAPTVPLDLPQDFMATEEQSGRQTAMLHERISRLEPFDRAIILLWLEDLPYDEIAAITGLSTKAVAVRLVRIKEKMKSL